MTFPTPRAARALRAGLLALGSALALAACEEQPVGSFQNAAFVADGSRATQSLYFQPGSASLRPGETDRLRAFLGTQLLSPETDIRVHVGSTGQPLLDARRRGTLKASMPRTPARVRLVALTGTLGADMRTDAAEVEVVQYNRLVIQCPGNPAADYELTTPLPNDGCSNAKNLAYMAESVRDLTDPREFHGSEGVTSVAAVQRHREGKVLTTPLGITTGN